MAKLNTLKDLIKIDTGLDPRAVDVEVLRQEAIKWFYLSECTNTGDKTCTCAAEFIKEFFNLTEVDLR